MLKKIKIGRVKDVDITSTNGHDNSAVTITTGTAQVYDKQTGATIGGSIAMAVVSANVARFAVPKATTDLFTVGQEIELRATINGQDQSVYFVADRWE